MAFGPGEPNRSASGGSEGAGVGSTDPHWNGAEVFFQSPGQDRQHRPFALPMAEHHGGFTLSQQRQRVMVSHLTCDDDIAVG